MVKPALAVPVDCSHVHAQLARLRGLVKEHTEARRALTRLVSNDAPRQWVDLAQQRLWTARALLDQEADHTEADRG